MLKSASTMDVSVIYKLRNCKWCEKVVDRALVTEMTVEPGAASDLDTGGEDVHAVTDTLTPEQRHLVR